MDLLGLILSFLGLFVGLLASPFFGRLIERLRKKKSWKDLEKVLKASDLETLIREFSPDVIIGLNAGIVPAAVLAWNHPGSELQYFQVAYSERNRGSVEGPSLELSGKKVLVVDDQCYTGKGMDILVQHLCENLGVADTKLKTVALFFDEDYKDELPLDLKLQGVSGSIKEVSWSYSPIRLPLYRDRTGGGR